MSGGETLGMKSRGGALEEDLYTIQLADEEVSPYLDSDSAELLAALRQKEKELTLAAKLGKALLEENQALKEQKDRLQEGFMERIEELQQENHGLRMRYKGQEVEWDARIYELETDAQELRAEVAKMQGIVREAEKNKAEAVWDLTEQNQRLSGQLNKMLQAEQGLVAEVQALREDSRDGVQSFYREAAQTQTLQDEVAMLAQERRDLEQQIAALVTENVLFQTTVTTLRNEVSELEKHSREQLLQLQQNQQESREAWALNRELQAQLQEMQEEMSLRGLNAGDNSLLSEIEDSLEAESWEKNQGMTAVESPERPCPLCQRCLMELPNVSEQQAVLEKLQSENVELKQQNSELWSRLEESQTEKGLQRALRERDDAIAKKNAIEAELIKCRSEVRSLNNQLLEAIQQKVELSQEVEAWQEDMQSIISQQLKAQQQKDERRFPASSHSKERREAPKLWNPFQRRGSTQSTESNGFFSLFNR